MHFNNCLKTDTVYTHVINEPIYNNEQKNVVENVNRNVSSCLLNAQFISTDFVVRGESPSCRLISTASMLFPLKVPELLCAICWSKQNIFYKLAPLCLMHWYTSVNKTRTNFLLAFYSGNLYQKKITES